MDPITLWLLVALGSALLAGTLTWAAVRSWLYAPRSRAALAKLFKTRLASGKVGVVAGIFDAGGDKLAEKAWEAEALDEELKQKFAGGSVAYIRL
jgi:transposase